METQNDSSQGMYSSQEIRKLARNQIFIMIISSLCLIFSIATTILFASTELTKNNTESRKKVTLNGISQSEIDEAVEKIILYYNKSDMDGLYNVLGEYAKSQVSFEDLKKSMSEIKTLGNISNKTFMDVKLIQDNNVGKWYEVNYSALYERGNGTLRINYLLRNSKYEIVGYKFNIEYLRRE